MADRFSFGVPYSLFNWILWFFSGVVTNCSCFPLRRYVSPPSQMAHGIVTAASSNNSAQTDALIRENERLRKELEVYVEKAARLQKVREEGGAMAHRGCGSHKGNSLLPVHVRVMRRLATSEIPVTGSLCGGGRLYLWFSHHLDCPTLCLSNMLALPQKGDKCLDTWEQSVHSGMLIHTFQLRILTAICL